MKSRISIFNSGVVELGLAVAWFFAPPEYKAPGWEASIESKDAIVILSLCLISVAHWHLATYRSGLVPYGKVFLNYWVIDWGPFGSEFEMPEHVCTPFPHWVAVHPSQVESTAQDIEERLRAAGNVRFTDAQTDKAMQITVKRLFFRVGERANESAQEYHTLAQKLLERERVEFFSFIHNNPKMESDWIYDHYLEKGYNGSADN
jgi:hypothetical protein